MIKFNRNTKVPLVLKSPKVRTTKARLKKIIDSGTTTKSGGKDGDFPSHWLDDELRESLWLMQHRKCCYCERPRDLKREPDIEHFRPKAEIEGEPKPGYWWLAYEWGNLFFSCKTCNQEHKKNQFPLRAGGKRARTPDDDLELELPYLINPETENPEDFIVYTWVNKLDSVYSLGLDSDRRGHETIRILCLNRVELCLDRGSLITTMEGIVKAYHFADWDNNDSKKAEFTEMIRKETSSERRFCGFRRYNFRSAGLGQFVSSD